MPSFVFALFSIFLTSVSYAHSDPTAHWVQITARDKFQRTALQELGVSIEFTRSDSVWGFASDKALQAARKAGFQVLGKFKPEVGRGGHHGDPQLGSLAFPAADAAYHDYSELTNELRALETANPDLVKMFSIGKSVENREIWAIHINSDPEALRTSQSGKPGAIFMGAHHAREHLSVEVPLMLAQHLLRNRNDATIKNLLNSRDIWIIPLVNPDGAEYDISSNRYKVWRKNRRSNRGGTYGVDLNRNYSYRWGTGGSSTNPSEDTYMGPQPFSEPETVAVRDFVRSQPNAKILLSFHSFSELILYPWGHTNDPISVPRDFNAFRAMATTMSRWNGYKAQAASDLYIASGDTVDWAYGELGIFAFTFELSPAAGWWPSPGDFYPGVPAIASTFQANIKPCLYLIDLADDPYRSIAASPTGFLTNYVAPAVSND
jgi:carboxypeptidase T